MRRSLVVGNWKMHGSTASVDSLLKALLVELPQGLNVDVAVCPPGVFISQAAVLLNASEISLGSQNHSNHAEGAFTGEVSASMLAELSCRYAIIGHSERRELFGDTDKLVAEKFIAAQAAGMIPIFCVGESLEQRESGKALDVISRQIKAVIDDVGIGAFNTAVIAYEPIWAIGTGKTASPEEAQEVHASIRELLLNLDKGVGAGLQILYGGSVKPDNAAELFAKQDIDGALVGGASLNATDFAAICCAA